MARPDEAPARRWLFDAARPAPPSVSAAITEHYLADEAQALAELVARARYACRRRSPRACRRRRPRARRRRSAAGSRDAGGVDALLREYDLSSGEGIVLMCLAEALLRIPDADDGGSADRRQARLRGLAGAPGRERLAVRQRFDLGAAPDGPHRAAGGDRRGARVVLRAARSSASASRSCAPRCAKRCGSSASSS